MITRIKDLKRRSSTKHTVNMFKNTKSINIRSFTENIGMILGLSRSMIPARSINGNRSKFGVANIKLKDSMKMSPLILNQMNHRNMLKSNSIKLQIQTMIWCSAIQRKARSSTKLLYLPLTRRSHALCSSITYRSTSKNLTSYLIWKASRAISISRWVSQYEAMTSNGLPG